MKRNRILILNLFLIILLFRLTAFPVGNRIEGYFETGFGTNKENDIYEWNMWQPNTRFELKLTGNPIGEVETFLKIYAYRNYFDQQEYDSSDYDRLEFLEGHMRFRKSSGPKGFELNFFFREKRFWIGSPLLELTQDSGWDDKFGDNTQGVRADIWGINGFNIKLIAVDFSGGGGEDGYIGRITRSMFNGKFILGTSYLRKNTIIIEDEFDTENQHEDYNQVVAGDFKISIKGIDLFAEYAESKTKLDSEVFEDQEASPDAYKVEIRNIKIGNFRTGIYNINFSYRDIGENYTNWMGKSDNDQVGYNLNSYYLVAGFAITFTFNYDYQEEHNEVQALYKPEMTLNTKEYFYYESYIEFTKGFKSKLYFRNGKDFWYGEEYEHNDIFSELIVENKLGFLKTQFKIKDIDSQFEKYIYGTELVINLSDKFRLFTRYLNVLELGKNRENVFVQFQYYPGSGAELFLEYGNSGYGNDGLVDDDDFISGGDNENRVQLIFKVWF
ncbi:hypothetical protein KAU33_04715 [Candidatus Dependentiae bacterium]|nr:hypothetical protein [Candidatus Dependentiae bacterium]